MRVDSLDDLRDLERKTYALGLEDLAAALGTACDLIEEAQSEVRSLERRLEDANTEIRSLESRIDNLEVLP